MLLLLLASTLIVKDFLQHSVLRVQVALLNEKAYDNEGAEKDDNNYCDQDDDCKIDRVTVFLASALVVNATVLAIS